MKTMNEFLREFEDLNESSELKKAGYTQVNGWNSGGHLHQHWVKEHHSDSKVDRVQSSIIYNKEKGKDPVITASHHTEKGYWTYQGKGPAPKVIVHHKSNHSNFSDAVSALDKLQKESFIEESGPFSYGAKKPRKGSIADLAAKKRKEQEKTKPVIEPKDQMVGVAKVTTEEENVVEDAPVVTTTSAGGDTGAMKGDWKTKHKGLLLNLRRKINKGN